MGTEKVIIVPWVDFVFSIIQVEGNIIWSKSAVLSVPLLLISIKFFMNYFPFYPLISSEE